LIIIRPGILEIAFAIKSNAAIKVGIRKKRICLEGCIEVLDS